VRNSHVIDDEGGGPAGRGATEAFTLVEMMIVVGVVGLLAALVVPNMVMARKQSQGRRVVNDVRQMDAAISEWAMDTSQADGAAVNTTQAATYLKSAWPTVDILKNRLRVGTVGTNQITISKRTKNALAGVGIDWGPY
jgi:prepilin-type N-terminal cleavage/methylation domain-containing protein